MEKPSTILAHDFKQKLTDTINCSGLPAFVIAPILRQALTEVELIEQQQYNADLEAYNKQEK